MSAGIGYRDDYPKVPIGGGNPYYQCKHCKRSAPEINGEVEGHAPWCEWRQVVQALRSPEERIKRLEDMLVRLGGIVDDVSEHIPDSLTRESVRNDLRNLFR